MPPAPPVAVAPPMPPAPPVAVAPPMRSAAVAVAARAAGTSTACPREHRSAHTSRRMPTGGCSSSAGMPPGLFRRSSDAAGAARRLSAGGRAACRSSRRSTGGGRSARSAPAGSLVRGAVSGRARSAHRQSSRQKHLRDQMTVINPSDADVATRDMAIIACRIAPNLRCASDHLRASWSQAEGSALQRTFTKTTVSPLWSSEPNTRPPTGAGRWARLARYLCRQAFRSKEPLRVATALVICRARSRLRPV